MLAVFVFALAFQGSRGLWEPDEGRYADIAAHMLRSGDFLRPAFNDREFHFAKPPLAYWSIAAGVELLGRNEWGVRLANALLFAATVLAVFALARTIVPARPWLASLIYASFLLPYNAANVVTPDTLLAFWETLAVLGFVRHWQSGERRAGALLLMWLALGLAFMTKGPPGLLPLLAIVGFAALAGGRRALADLANGPGVALFACVGLAWYVYLAATIPGVAGYFVWNEFFLRIFSGAHHRHAEWYGAVVVYVPTLVLGTLPWTWVIARAPRQVFSRAWWRGKLREDPWMAFLALWLLVPLLVFFLSRSRLPLYVLPLFPALALIAARRLGAWTPSRGTLALLALWLAALVGLRVALAQLPYEKDGRTLARAIATSRLPAPGKVIFVDTDPVWGIGLYLGCEVERVTLGGAAGAQAPGQETLASELASLRQARPLIVTAASSRREVDSELIRLGYQPVDLEDAGSRALIAPATSGDGRLARRPGDRS